MFEPPNPRLRIGCSGWIYAHWREIFYPKGLPASRWFEFYSQHFDTVEINNTFYRLPAPETFDGWREQAPSNFLYAVKASRYLTHLRKLTDPEPALENILPRVRRLSDHLGPVLYQLPPRWKRNLERLRAFLKALPQDLQHVIEFRDQSWIHEETRQALAEYNVSYCMHDMRGLPWADWITGPLVYIRFHGSTEPDSGGRYSEPQLQAWADRIRGYLATDHPVYLYFNNDWGGHAIDNARQIRELLV